MVQIKRPDRHEKTDLYYDLYIPYGSNKTASMSLPLNMKVNFISHMVQIKLCGGADAQPPIQTLYPIWFK